MLAKALIAVIGTGVAALGAYNVANTGCVLGACSTSSAAAMTEVAYTPEEGQTAETGSAKAEGDSCCPLGKAQAVAAESSDCAKSCEGEAATTLVASETKAECATACSTTTVASEKSDCATKCSGEAEGVTLVAAEGDCSKAKACSGEAMQVAEKSDCASKCSGEAAATTLVAAESGECSKAKACSGDTMPVAEKSDCAKSCDGAAVQQVAETKDCASKCEGEAAATTLVAAEAGECSKAKTCSGDTMPVAEKSDCAKSCDGAAVQQVAETKDCAKSCDGAAVQQVAAEGDCAKSCDGEATLVADNAECVMKTEACTATQVAGKPNCCTASGEAVQVAIKTMNCEEACDGTKSATMVAAFDAIEACMKACHNDVEIVMVAAPAEETADEAKMRLVVNAIAARHCEKSCDGSKMEAMTVALKAIESSQQCSEKAECSGDKAAEQVSMEAGASCESKCSKSETVATNG